MARTKSMIQQDKLLCETDYNFKVKSEPVRIIAV
jgi:hypothetical protein